MLKLFTTICPTKDKKVDVVVDYISAGSLNGKQTHIKGIIRSCSGSPTGCSKCELYHQLPQQL